MEPIRILVGFYNYVLLLVRVLDKMCWLECLVLRQQQKHFAHEDKWNCSAT